MSVPSDQLLCFPRAVDALKGFSCSNRRKPWLRATLRMSDMMSMLWSTAKLHSSKNGSQLKLVGSHFVMAGLDGYAQFQRLYFKASS